MKFFSIFVLLFAAIFVSAQQASSSSRVAVVGAKGGIYSNGKRPSRLGINGMHSKGGPNWDLYIQALAAFQAVEESNKYSYFQVVGIHGLPFVSWNGVGNVNGGGGGYCPHSEVLFASWHRPFLALFEQILQIHATRIANKYTGSKKATYVAAAKTLRIPYWDWARDPKLPKSTTAQQITINTPTGRKTIRNPLYSYRFQKFPFTYANFGGTLGNYAQTMRCPSSNSRSATSRLSVVNNNLARDGSYLRDSVYLTFTRTNNFAVMSSDSQGGYTFESPHNTVHNDIGCGDPTGHMTNLGWSAFDPIFMLHHANVDRLIAMWQAAHPSQQTFSGTFRASSARWGTAAGSSYTSTTGLKPFYKSDLKNFWSSNTARSTRTFGYTYPELQDWTMSSSELQRSVISTVNKLYGSSSLTANNNLAARQENIVTQYEAKISVNREDLQLPCKINMYLGDDLAGTFTVLSMPATGPSFGLIPLQAPLQNLASDVVEDPVNSVVGFLKKALRVEMVAGTVVKDILDVPSLSVDLQVSKVQPPANEFEFPEYLNTTNVAVQLKDLVDTAVEKVDGLLKAIV
jgi:tyrosinase